MLGDTLGRPLRDLRISVTDRCNFRCPYCMPKEVFGLDFPFLPREDLLSYEEIYRLARIFCRLGVNKLRITGGEPLLRRDLPALVRRLAAIPNTDLALTTNGSLLPVAAPSLVEAGLTRVTVSLDSLDDEVFRAMNDVNYPVTKVLEGIAAAEAAGLTPIKINAVVKRGVNEDGLVDLAKRFRGTGHIVRFIEYMDVGVTNGWQLEDVVPAGEIADRIHQVFPIEPIKPNYAGEVARRWRYQDGKGEIGIVSSVSKPFCGDCTRGRLSTDGQLFTCLFATQGTDVRTPLRGGATDRRLTEVIQGAWKKRTDRYSELRSEETIGLGDGRKIEMSYIGG